MSASVVNGFCAKALTFQRGDALQGLHGFHLGRDIVPRKHLRGGERRGRHGSETRAGLPEILGYLLGAHRHLEVLGEPVLHCYGGVH